MVSYRGRICKLATRLDAKVYYDWVFETQDPISFSGFVGKEISIQFCQAIYCCVCGQKIKKSFFQGFCYPCFQSSAEASECIIRPELCRAHLGCGRDVEWEKRNHDQPHFVYLAVSSGLKVGVTRKTYLVNRWMDQGASFGIRFAEVPNRYTAGLIEVALMLIFI